MSPAAIRSAGVTGMEASAGKFMQQQSMEIRFSPFLKNGAICSFFHKFVVGEIVSCDSVHFVPKKLNQKSQKTIQPWEKR
jgi:hypothetical protein